MSDKFKVEFFGIKAEAEGISAFKYVFLLVVFALVAFVFLSIVLKIL